MGICAAVWGRSYQANLPDLHSLDSGLWSKNRRVAPLDPVDVRYFLIQTLFSYCIGIITYYVLHHTIFVSP